MNTFLFMYMNLCDVIICYLELRKTRSVFPIPLEFEISKFACMCYIVELLLETLGSIDISTSHEAMIYCIGALKFLTGNSTIA